MRHPERNRRRARDAAPGRRAVDRGAFVLHRRPDAGRRLARCGRWLRLRAACRFAACRPSVPKDENELIIPAREGTLRVLRAARDAGVRRVVITSSMARHRLRPSSRKARPSTRPNWTNLDGLDVQPYVKSKTLAERAAWDFVAGEGGGLELSVVNPVGRVRSRAGAGFLRLDRHHQGAARWQHAGGAENLFRPGRRARRRRSASARDDSRRRRKASGSSRSPARRCRSSRSPKCCGASSAAAARGCRGCRRPIGWFGSPRRRDPMLRDALPMLGKIRRCQQRQGARKVLGWTPRGNDEMIVVHRRKPDQARPRQAVSAASRVMRLSSVRRRC